MANTTTKKPVTQVHFPLTASELKLLKDAAARGFRPVSQQARLAVIAWLESDARDRGAK